MNMFGCEQCYLYMFDAADVHFFFFNGIRAVHRYGIPIIFSSARIAIAVDLVDYSGQLIVEGVQFPGKVLIVQNKHHRRLPKADTCLIAHCVIQAMLYFGNTLSNPMAKIDLLQDEGLFGVNITKDAVSLCLYVI